MKRFAILAALFVASVAYVALAAPPEIENQNAVGPYNVVMRGGSFEVHVYTYDGQPQRKITDTAAFPNPNEPAIIAVWEALRDTLREKGCPVPEPLKFSSDKHPGDPTKYRVNNRQATSTVALHSDPTLRGETVSAIEKAVHDMRAVGADSALAVLKFSAHAK